MTVRLFPLTQIFDNSGDVVNAALIYTYITGTTTNKTTYTSSTGLTENANPIVADSAGRFQAWLNTDGAYKFVIKSADAGTTYATLDVIYGMFDPLQGGFSLGGNIDMNGYAIQFDTTTGIQDDSSNEQLYFTKVTSAVNYLNITNAATGSNPIFGGLGSDTNVGIDFKAQGTPVYRFLGTATAASEMRWLEDTDNGTNYIGHKAAASIASSFTLTWPSALPASSMVLQSDSSGTLTFVSNTPTTTQTVKTDTFTTSSATFVDITGLSVSMTPGANTNRVLIFTSLCVCHANNPQYYQFVRDSTAIFVGDTASNRQRTSMGTPTVAAAALETVSFCYIDSPATTSATTYKVQTRGSAATAMYINRSDTDTDTSAFGRGASMIMVMELGAT